MRFLSFHTDRCIKDNVPLRRMKPINLAWLNAIIAPLLDIYNAFKTYYIGVEEQLRYNSQTMVMEGLLNDYFDPTFRRIYITTASERDDIYYSWYDTENGPELYLYYAAEGKPPLYTYYSTEALGVADFFVYVPAGLSFDDLAMRNKINRYKLATKRYIIIQ